jgi:signal peptidase II
VTATQRLAAWLYAAAAAAYAADRLTKLWAEHALAGRRPIEVIPGVLRFTYTTNSGGAFGLGGSAPLLFAAATLVVSVVIVAYSFRMRHLLISVSLGLVLGGALGNLTDRMLRGNGFGGRVVDFVDLRVWPVFNLADSAIVVGAALLLLATARHREADG